LKKYTSKLLSEMFVRNFCLNVEADSSSHGGRCTCEEAPTIIRKPVFEQRPQEGHSVWSAKFFIQLKNVAK
jgi:hypothetical protein